MKIPVDIQGTWSTWKVQVVVITECQSVKGWGIYGNMSLQVIRIGKRDDQNQLASSIGDHSSTCIGHGDHPQVLGGSRW